MCCFKCDGSAFDFHNDGVTIQPSQEMPNVNASSKLIDNHVCLALVTAPEFRPRILRESGEKRFRPCTARLTGSGSAPKDVNGPFDGLGDEVVGCDRFERPVVGDISSGVQFVKSTRFSQLADGVPVSLGVSLVSQSSQFELGPSDAGVFFPDVLEGSVGASEFGVERSKYSTYSGDAGSSSEGNHELPMKKALSAARYSCSSLELTSDVVDPAGEIGSKFCMRDSEDKVTTGNFE